MYKNQGIIAGKSKCKSTRIKGRGSKLLAKRTVSSNTCTLETIIQYLDMQTQGRQNATMVSVCVKGKELVQKKPYAYIIVRTTADRKTK